MASQQYQFSQNGYSSLLYGHDDKPTSAFRNEDCFGEHLPVNVRSTTNTFEGAYFPSSTYSIGHMAVQPSYTANNYTYSTDVNKQYPSNIAPSYGERSNFVEAPNTLPSHSYATYNPNYLPTGDYSISCHSSYITYNNNNNGHMAGYNTIYQYPSTEPYPTAAYKPQEHTPSPAYSNSSCSFYSTEGSCPNQRPNFLSALPPVAPDYHRTNHQPIHDQTPPPSTEAVSTVKYPGICYLNPTYRLIDVLFQAPSSLESCQMILNANKALNLVNTGNFQEFYDFVSKNQFRTVDHDSLQQLWLHSLYCQHAAIKTTELTPVDRHR